MSQAVPATALTGLAALLDGALPQTQCTRCGYADCRAYALAMADGLADINRCPPGGDEGMRRLAHIAGRSPLALDPACGSEGPRWLAVIDEAWCIGCTLCIKACPVDCIVGVSKRMHTVIQAECTGCELCLPACPVDCISLQPAQAPQQPLPTGWAAWSPDQAESARQRYDRTKTHRSDQQQQQDQPLSSKARTAPDDLPCPSRISETAAMAARRSVVEAALRRVRERQAASAAAAAASPEDPC